jgi:hypothetical protein
MNEATVVNACNMTGAIQAGLHVIVNTPAGHRVIEAFQEHQL